MDLSTFGGWAELLGYIATPILFFLAVWRSFTNKTIPEKWAEWGWWPMKGKTVETASTNRKGRVFNVAMMLTGIALFAILLTRQISDVDQMNGLRTRVGELEKSLAASDATIADLRNQPGAIVRPINPAFKSLPLKSNEMNFVNVGIENSGPYTARNAAYAAKIRLYPTPHSTAEEKQFLDEFSDLVRRQLDIEVRRDVVKDGSIWRSIEFGFNQETTNDLFADQQRLYVLLRYRWEDKSGAHEAEQCTFLRPPPTDAVWRLCDSHNVVAE